MASGRQWGRSGFDARGELVVEIVAGEGGEDSRQFAAELLGVYVRYAQAKGLDSELLADDPAHLTARFAGRGVWPAFRGEPGNHVVQRVPRTAKNGKRHTSLVAVMVLPLPKPTDARSLLPEAELDWKAQCKGGPGGQHRNKSQTAVRMTHGPTGLSVFIDGRSQQQNKETARRILSARVSELRAAVAADGYDGVRRGQWTGAGRGTKVRTYNFIDTFVADHRTGIRTADIKAVMKGRLDLVLGG